MEFVFAPKNPASPLAKVPYVAPERYDGLSFLSYGTRMGLSVITSPGQSGLVFDFRYRLLRDQITMLDQEQLFQSWLFFGLIAEVVGANSQLEAPDESAETIPAATRQEILASIYDSLLYEEDGHTFVSTAKLIPLLEAARPRMSKDPAVRLEKYKRLGLCLQYAWSIINFLPANFNHEIHSSIAALGDFINELLNFGLYHIGAPEARRPYQWSRKYYNDSIQTSMIANGWCPSDITRVSEKFMSMQSLHLIRLLDRPGPSRGHSNCSGDLCVASQIDMLSYNVTHRLKDCSCELASIDMSVVSRALAKEASFPVLRLGGEGEELEIEALEIGDEIEYIAISHVWVDGLGNPFENTLHRCQLTGLRDKVRIAISSGLDPTKDTTQVYVWLDTMCCPVRPLAEKQKAIEKIRDVYVKAAHVLVLDASLQVVEAKEIGLAEQLARIFTSGWMRRLWTLQEGALANSLVFQFADCALQLRELFLKGSTLASQEFRYRCFFRDLYEEHIRLRCFFHRQVIDMEPSLGYLDRTLQHRAVSVWSDEPLCITTLMGLDIKKTTSDDHLVRESDETTEQLLKNSSDLLQIRMKRVWEQLVERLKGVPVDIIFVEERKLKQAGWRWASETFLRTHKEGFDFNMRFVHFSCRRFSRPTKIGLMTRSPGFQIQRRTFDDGRPRNPWIGLPRIPEAAVVFLDDSGLWYLVVSREYERMGRNWTSEERDAYNAKQLFPIHDLAAQPGSVIITRLYLPGVHDSTRNVTEGVVCVKAEPETNDIAVELDSSVLSSQDADSSSSTTPQEATQQWPEKTADPLEVPIPAGALQRTDTADFMPAQRPTTYVDPPADGEAGLPVSIRLHVMISKMDPLQARVYATVERLAIQLRSHELTDKLLSINEESTEEREPVIADLKQLMKDVMKEALEGDEQLREGVRLYLGNGMEEHVWVMIGDYFYHGFEAVSVDPNQLWYVD